MTDGAKTSLTLRLAAIAFADVADYSRHMSGDSVATVRRWARLKQDILLPNLELLSGRLVN